MQRIESAGLTELVERLERAVRSLLEDLPGGWNRSYHTANHVGALLECQDELRAEQGLPLLCPQVATWGGGCWVEAVWGGKAIVLDFSQNEPVVTYANDPTYVQKREAPWPTA
jgi:hypothetical protein